MKKYILILILLGIAGTASASWYNPISWFQGEKEISLGALPYFTQTGSIIPGSDTVNNNIGTTSPSNLRYNGYFKNLQVEGTCTGCSVPATFPWTPAINYGEKTNSTTTAIWIKENLYASSTIYAPNFTAESTTATSTFQNTSITGAVSLLGEYFTNFTTYVRSLFTAGNGLSLSAGQFSINSTGLSDNSLITWNGSNLVATGTPNLTAGFFTATSTAATSTFANAINITGANATSTISGNLYVVKNLQVDGNFFAPVTLISSGNATINGTLTVSGQTTLSGLGQGWVHTAGGSNALTASTSPTVNYIVATSTAKNSTFAGKVGIGTTAPEYKLQVGNIGGGLGTGNAAVEGAFFVGEPNSQKTIYLYNDGTILKLDAYDYGASVPLPVTIGGNGGNVLLAPSGGGNVGIGTASPGVKLEIGTTAQTSGNWEKIISDTGSLNLISHGSTDGGSNAGITQGLKMYATGNFPLVISHNAAQPIVFGTNDIERMRITGAGSVGIGTTTPWRTLSVTGTVGFDGLTGATGAGSLCLDSNKQVVYNSGSDACLSSTRATKHDIQTLNLDGLSLINSLQPSSFIYNQGDGRTRYGFMAEDTALVDDRLATHNEKGEITGIDDRAILSVVVKAVKEIGIKLQKLVARVSGLEQRVNQQEKRIDELEKIIQKYGH